MVRRNIVLSHSWELKGLTSQSSNFKCPRGLQEEEGGMVEEEGEILKLQIDRYIQFVRVGKGGGGEEEETNLKFIASQKGASLLQLF